MDVHITITKVIKKIIILTIFLLKNKFIRFNTQLYNTKKEGIKITIVAISPKRGKSP
jgi:hypothetical protein